MGRHLHEEIAREALERSRHPDARERRAALHDMCPCEQKRVAGALWDRILEMRSDPDPGVRRAVIHALCDGSPAERESQVIDALESLEQDPDRRARRMARQVMAQYRRTGRINVL